MLLEQHENYLYYVKDQEESIIERFLNERMENDMIIITILNN